MPARRSAPWASLGMQLMTTQTLSLKFADRATQARRQQRLEELCGQLMREGVATKMRVQAVFPGHDDPLMSALFTIEVDGAQTDLLPRFRAVSGVEYAQVAPQRRELRGTRPADGAP